MNGYGLQTQDFLRRLKAYGEALPPLLRELAQVMERLIQEIEAPQLEDIQRLQARLKEATGGPEALREVCGQEGEHCLQCPFGAYLPAGFPYASESQTICLPWIAVLHFSPAP